MLEDEAHRELLAVPDGPTVLRSKIRTPEHMLFVAAEFTWLADTLEGKEPT